MSSGFSRHIFPRAGSATIVVLLLALLMVQAASAGTVEELRALVDESRYEEAIALAGSMLAELQAAEADGGAKEADILECWVEALYRTGAAAEPHALEMAERAVALRSIADPEDTTGLVSSLLHLGNLYIYRAQTDSARALYTRAVDTLERQPDPDPAQLALALNNLGVTWKVSGDYGRALECYERALDSREELLGPDHPDVAASLNNLANVFVILGDYEGARVANERALAIREAHYGPENEWVAESLNNLANVLGYAGDYETALATQERAVGVFAATLGEDHERYWAARMNLGAIYDDLGDHVGARAIYEDVLRREQEHFGSGHPELVETMDSLAISLIALGDFRRAEDLLEASLQISTQAYGEGGGNSAYTLQSLGECLYEVGRYDEAAERFESALHLWEADLEPDSPELSELMHLVAKVRLAEGDFDSAAALARESAVNVETGLGPDHPLLAEALRIDALAASAVGDRERAMDSALRAESVSRRHAAGTIRVLSESRALDMAMSRTFGLDLAAGLLEDGEQSPRVERVYDALIGSRGLLFDELALRQRSYDRIGDPSVGELVEGVQSARTRLANLTVRGPGWEEVSVYRRNIEDARQQKREAERELALVSDLYRAEWEQTRAGLDEVAAALPPGSVLVSFVKTDAVEYGEPAFYAAFTLAPGEAHPRFVRLGAAEVIDDLVLTWREQAAWGASGGGSARGMMRRSRDAAEQVTTYADAARRLREAIWDPVIPDGAGASHVFVVFDGNLHMVSLYALPADDGAFLVEAGPTIRRIPAERFLAGAPEPGPDSGSSPTALLLGDPEYGAPPGSGDSPAPGLVFDPLPGARREVEELELLWRRQHPEPTSASCLTGEQATETEFKDRAHGPALLHLATHGFMLAAAETATDVPDDGVGNPLLRTGLAFAGANEVSRDADEIDDGILTAEELAALDLTHADWAVLSACSTGLGEIRGRGEGVFGLARAFQIAGARTVVMSLWEVEDQAALDWMRALYEARLEKGLATDESVRQASMRTLDARREAGLSDHPFYWAGFISTGDWR